jgi:F0F1-type ATP synthase membrane subunit b/b'
MSLENDPALAALDVIAQTILKGINCSVEVALVLKGHLDTIEQALSERQRLVPKKADEAEKLNEYY